MDDLSVRRAAAYRYATALFGSAPKGSLVEVRFPVPLGMGQRFYRVSALDRLVEAILELSVEKDVYVGVLARRRRGGGRTDVIEPAAVIWADCDSPESVLKLREFRPPPTMVVASSTQKRHAYWLLSEPMSLDAIEETNRRLARALGADPICFDAARIFRPAGSVNRKRGEPEAVRLLHLAPRHVSLAALDRVLPPTPAPPSRRPRHRSAPRRLDAIIDPYKLIPAAVYFPRLAGIELPERGNISCPCPWHPDENPSCSVGAYGWRCHGCGAGWSIYDLASAVRGGPTGDPLEASKKDFREAKRLVRETFGDLQSPAAPRTPARQPAARSRQHTYDTHLRDGEAK